MTASDSTPTKACASCKDCYPATAEFFGSRKFATDGLRGYCRACSRQMAAKHRHKYKDKVRIKNAIWAEKNRDKLRATSTAWNAAHREEAKAATRAWVALNKDAVRVNAQNRRARKLGNGGTLSKGLRPKLMELQKGLCACCKQPLGASPHLDHIMPLALGGPNTDDNIQLLRASCNASKHDRHPIDFMQSRGFLL